METIVLQWFCRRDIKPLNYHFKNATVNSKLCSLIMLKLEREELYRQAWSKPMIHLAKEYGLSDNGLRKICKRYKIPLPDIGYWQKIQYGKPVKRQALPELDGGSEISIERSKKEFPPVGPEFYNETQKRITQELLPANRILVSDMPAKIHPLVMQAKKNVSTSFGHEDCIVSARGFLDIFVSRMNMNRALCIMDALTKALEIRGIPIFIKSEEYKSFTCIDVLGKVFIIDLRETLQRIEARDDRYNRFDFKPTGQLVLRIKNGYGDYRRQWSDGKKQKVENCLNSFIIGLYEAALWERGSELESERKHREWEEKKHREEEARRLKEEELGRIKDLENEASDWRKSRNIRFYIKAVEKAYIQKNGPVQPGSEFEKWKKWATQQADRLDPVLK